MSLRNNKSLKIVLIIFSIITVAILGSVFVNLGMDWFNELTKPMQWIPNIIIPIVWTIIYLVFGIVFSIWVSRKNLPRSVLFWLIVNGVLNVLWCLIFFALNLTFVGNIVIIVNLIAGIILFKEIYKANRLYAIITSIYPIWLSLATSLNTALWILN